MEIYREYFKPLNKYVTVYKYNADDEDPDCGKCIHVCDSEKICNECGTFWLNYQRCEYVEEDESKNDIREFL